MTAKFEALLALESGWCEGRGEAPDKNLVRFVAEKFAEDYPETLALPLIVATPEGDLLFEWDAPGSPSVDLELASLTMQFHAFAPDGSDIECEFALSGPAEWHLFFELLRDNLGTNPQ